MERMVQADQGGGFGHPVALHHHETQRGPEVLHLGRECRAAYDQCPELPTQSAVYVAEDPPSPPGRVALGFLQPRWKVRETLREVRSDHLHDAGYRGQDRYPLAVYHAGKIPTD